MIGLMLLSWIWTWKCKKYETLDVIVNFKVWEHWERLSSCRVNQSEKVIRSPCMLNNYLLQMREIMAVLDPKFDHNLQKNLTRSQNSVIWAWIYAIWNIKTTFWKFIFFVHLSLWNVKEYAKIDFSKFWTQIY